MIMQNERVLFYGMHAIAACMLIAEVGWINIVMTLNSVITCGSLASTVSLFNYYQNFVYASNWEKIVYANCVMLIILVSVDFYLFVFPIIEKYRGRYNIVITETKPE